MTTINASTRSEQSHTQSLVPEDVAAEFLGVSKRTLQKWRLRGGGPQFVRASTRAIRYRLNDLISWSEQRLCASTSSVLPPLRR